MYHLYFIPGDMQVKNATAYAYKDSPRSLFAPAYTEVDWPATKEVKAHEQKGEEIDIKDGEGVSQIRNYFIFVSSSEE